MNILLSIVAAIRSASADPTFGPTTLEVDLSAFFSLKSEVSEGEEEREHTQIFPGVARILHDAGVPLIDPTREDDRELLKVAGVPTVDVPAAQPINRLRLEFSSPDFMKSIYRIHVSVQRSDGSYEAIPALRCGPDCLSENVEPFLREHQAAILALLETETPTPAEAEPATVPSRSHAPSSRDGLSATSASSKRSPLGPVGIAGIVAAGVGLGGTVWGAVTLGLDRNAEWQDGPTERERSPRYFNTGTGVALGVGAGLLTAGVVMILVDQLALKKRRNKPSAMRLAPLRLSF